MTLARESALIAGGVMQTTTVDGFIVDLAKPAAQRHLDDDRT